MKIIKYKCQSRGDEKWDFSEVQFGNLNLLVGNSATGKTRLLNTLFNIGAFVARDEYRAGYWDIIFEHNASIYHWVVEADTLESSQDQRIISEKLIKIENDSETLLIDRNTEKFIFTGNPLPKLSPKITAISLLKEEEIIQPIHEGFGKIRRRRFFHDALSKITELEPIPQELLENLSQKATLKQLNNSHLGLNATLYILSIYFNDLYNVIRENFKIAFPFIADTKIMDFSQVIKQTKLPIEIPVFCIKEKSTPEWIPITEASSGMQKVLLILTDSYTLSEDSIYIIDEYENSLGLNAIDFFPNFLLGFEKKIQFFLTSHHPYIINEIPPKNWYVFNRRGNKVTIKYGEEIEKRFGKSRQQAFIQLINDPFYIDGVE
jgi:hypothetical protein